METGVVSVFSLSTFLSSFFFCFAGVSCLYKKSPRGRVLPQNHAYRNPSPTTSNQLLDLITLPNVFFLASASRSLPGVVQIPPESDSRVGRSLRSNYNSTGYAVHVREAGTMTPPMLDAGLS